ncbi:MAG TPA: dephospho-CoA kinase [Vicinamibacterales bacterium]|nr:dephospho-CoA kinase [Vicinamibacterales bacterium]
MIRIGLTGGIATGKSHVVRLLREAGVPVVDSDVLARDAVAAGTPGLADIVERFGPGILMASGELDRARLGELVFGDLEARRDLEAIVHPVVRRGIAEFFRALPPDTPLAAADIPLLFETHGERNFDKVIVVACARATQIERVIARDGLSRDAAERRVAAQLPIEEKVRRADYVISTDGTFEETGAQVAALLASLRS